MFHQSHKRLIRTLSINDSSNLTSIVIIEFIPVLSTSGTIYP